VVALLVTAALLIVGFVGFSPARSFYLAMFGSGDVYQTTWDLDHSYKPEDTSVHLLVHEARCSGGESPEGRILNPKIVYAPTTIAITVELVAAAAVGCPTSPDYLLTVNLNEPIGARQIIDGASVEHLQP
jgi:hypothetical protein